jgi:hypothetical protein
MLIIHPFRLKEISKKSGPGHLSVLVKQDALQVFEYKRFGT